MFRGTRVSFVDDFLGHLETRSSRSARNFDSRSAIWTLFRSDIGKCVLPRMPAGGSERDVAAVLVYGIPPEPRRRAKTRHCSCAGFVLGWSGMLSP